LHFGIEEMGSGKRAFIPMWKEILLTQQILQNTLFSDISRVSDNIGLTLFC
jgi:hypothetical protein